MRPIPILLSALAIFASGTAGGVALGGFATGGVRPAPTASDWAPSVIDSASAAEAPAPTVQGDAPESYHCRGCGLTLAERKAQSYSASYAMTDPGYDAAYAAAKDYGPLPAYRPIPYEGDEPVKLPTL